MFQVTIPFACAAECRYTIDIVLCEWLGIELAFIEDAKAEVISIAAEGRSIVLPGTFFLSAEANWLQYESLFSGSVYELATGLHEYFPERLPVFKELIEDIQLPLVTIDDDETKINFDLFGGIFYLLSRYEEMVVADRDSLGRFPARSSAQFKAGLMQRPLVNEYVELLWKVIKIIWPQCERNRREFQMVISHDIDHLAFHRQYSFLRGMKRAARACIDMDPSMACRFVFARQAVLGGRLAADPFFTLNELMDESESRGLASTFYFMAGGTDSIHDEDYDLLEPSVRQALKSIHDRGHYIGLHPSYSTFDNPDTIRSEMNHLRSVAENLGIQQKEWGSRQHYLRWETDTTPMHLKAAGISHDSTLGFAEQPGFRCGTCYEYPLYDFSMRMAHKLRERPLVVMDCSVMDSRYLGYGTGRRALDFIGQIKDQCRRYQGNFTLLWHNTRIVRSPEKRLYLNALDI